MSNVIQKASSQMQNAPQNKTMADYVKIMAPAIKAALPPIMTPERFTRITLSALSSTPKLQECTPMSFIGAMMTAAQLGLEPNTPLGQAYIIPYNNHGTMEAQFQLGYKGLVDLAYRSGEISIIQAHEVCENDEFEYAYGLEPKLSHIPATENRGKEIAYYAIFRTKNGGFGYDVMSVDEVRNHASKYSKGYSSNYSPWKTNFSEMAKKTVLKKCLKLAPLKSDFIKGLAQDESVKTELSDDMYSVPNTADLIEVDPSTGDVIEKDGADNA